MTTRATTPNVAPRMTPRLVPPLPRPVRAAMFVSLGSVGPVLAGASVAAMLGAPVGAVVAGRAEQNKWQTSKSANRHYHDDGRGASEVPNNKTQPNSNSNPFLTANRTPTLRRASQA